MTKDGTRLMKQMVRDAKLCMAGDTLATILYNMIHHGRKVDRIVIEEAIENWNITAGGER
jgi:hypothetical protein